MTTLSQSGVDATNTFNGYFDVLYDTLGTEAGGTTPCFFGTADPDQSTSVDSQFILRTLKGLIQNKPDGSPSDFVQAAKTCNTPLAKAMYKSLTTEYTFYNGDKMSLIELCSADWWKNGVYINGEHASQLLKDEGRATDPLKQIIDQVNGASASDHQYIQTTADSQAFSDLDALNNDLQNDSGPTQAQDVANAVHVLVNYLIQLPAAQDTAFTRVLRLTFHFDGDTDTAGDAPAFNQWNDSIKGSNKSYGGNTIEEFSEIVIANPNDAMLGQNYLNLFTNGDGTNPLEGGGTSNLGGAGSWEGMMQQMEANFLHQGITPPLN